MMHIKIAGLLRTATQANDDVGKTAPNAVPDPVDPAVSHSRTVPDVSQRPRASTMADARCGVDCERLWRMIAHTASKHPGGLGLRPEGTGGMSRQRKIIHFDPGEETGELEDAVRALHEIGGRQGAELGLVIAVNHSRFVALHLHQASNNTLWFHYYDPDPSADSRDKLKAHIRHRLGRCGIDIERPFTGVRQGREKSDVGHSGIYAVLAMREMLNGGSELKATTQDIHAWRQKLLMESGELPPRAEAGGAFMRSIQGRSEKCNLLAKRFAERCPALEYVVDCLPAREAVRYQALNKRMYREVMPRVMCQVSFQDYPALPRTSLWEVRSGVDDSVTQLNLPALSRETLFGYLLLQGGAPNHQMDRRQMHEYLEWLTKGMDCVSDGKPTPRDRYFNHLCQWLGEALRDAYANRNDKTTPGMQGKSQEPMSLVGLFRETDEIPEPLMNAIATKLEEAVLRNVISRNRKTLILNRLKPDSAHLAAGSTSINLVILREKGKAGRYVHVVATPNRIDGRVKPTTLWKFNDVVVDESRKIRLSGKLRRAIQRHFHKMGWADRLGVTLRQDAPLPGPHDASAMETLALSARKFSYFYDVSLEPTLPLVERQDARLAAEFAGEEMRQFFKKRISDIDLWAFRHGLIRIALLPDSKEMTLCRIASGLIDAVRPIVATHNLRPLELLKYRHIAIACHEQLRLWTKSGRIRNAQHAEAVNQVMSALDNEIRVIEAKLDMPGGGQKAEDGIQGLQSADRA